ncbi:hypothetical protein STEG23_007514, partial [Scotinomys teguina]
MSKKMSEKLNSSQLSKRNFAAASPHICASEGLKLKSVLPTFPNGNQLEVKSQPPAQSSKGKKVQYVHYCNPLHNVPTLNNTEKQSNSHVVILELDLLINQYAYA